LEAGSARVRNHANLIWGIAELLRGDYKRADYGKVILPLAVMRRLDQVLEPTREAVRARAAKLEAQGIEKPEPVLRKVAGQQFFNTHPLRFHQLLDDPGNIAGHLRSYIDGFSLLARDVVEKFEFDAHIDRLDRSNLLYQVIGRICQADLHPDKVSNHEMGAIFEELIRRFAEQSNETAGEHFTPREVVRLMVNLLLSGDEEALREPGIIREVFDCACGTGGMLSEADDHIRLANTQATVRLFGQELNAESYAICLADMLVKGQDASHIVFGNSLSGDGHAGQRFDYCIANPPFGVDWTKVADEVRDEHERLGFDGRFGAGLPRKSDGQLLFLMHLISKLRDADKRGTRIAIVHNGSPLFTGAAGSGESEIRRWIIENDRLEAIVALPEQLFYNTGIASYVWVLTNRKSEEREGKVQLIDARGQWVKMRKSLGEKRRELSAEQIDEVTKLHGAFAEGELVKIVDNEYFGYRTITIDRPLRAWWGVSAETWDGLVEDRALAKLSEEERLVAAAAMETLAGGRWETAPPCAAAVKDTLADVLSKPPSAALVKALVARCLVRDPELPEQRDAKGRVLWDPTLRDTENVPLSEDVGEYMEREVLPHVPDAHVEDPEGRIGYEIPFTRLFYKYTPPRPSEEIKAELREREARIRELLEEVLV
jgi:type I restriction enzyme M protein